MPTLLTKPVHRASNKKVSGKNIVITLGPGTGKRDDLIGFRLLGQRTQYVVTISDCYRMAALWHGQKVKAAKAAARKSGTPWARAKKDFAKQNSIPKQPPNQNHNHDEQTDVHSDGQRK